MIADLGPRRKAEVPVFLRETATSAHVNGHDFQIPDEGSGKALFGVMTMAFESENRTNRSGLLGHEMDQNLNAYLSVRFGRPLEGAPNNAP
jgi:hypothetical protein